MVRSNIQHLIGSRPEPVTNQCILPKVLGILQSQHLILSRLPRPVRVDRYRFTDPLGVPNHHSREIGSQEFTVPPRVTSQGSIEYDVACKWKVAQRCCSHSLFIIHDSWLPIALLYHSATAVISLVLCSTVCSVVCIPRLLCIHIRQDLIYIRLLCIPFAYMLYPSTSTSTGDSG